MFGVLWRMRHDTDQQLISNTLAGDTRAFGELVGRYQSFVFTIIIRMVQRREVAEEISQDTFVKAFQALSTYRGDSKFSSWLYSIAYRKTLDVLRKQKKERTSELIEDVTEGDLELVDNALHFLEQTERKRIIEESIQKLGAQEAAIITLYYFEDQSVKEIAAVTELSEDNIKIKLHRSRKKLFGLLKFFVLPEMTISNGRAI